MPWSTPSLKVVRSLVRDAIRGNLPGADASIPNSVLRVISDAMGALCHLALQFIDWLALQLLPDTAETVWLDRHGNIWLVNSDGTTGRKLASLAFGTVNFTGTAGTIVPNATQLTYGATIGQGMIGYETTQQITLGDLPTPATVRALDPGAASNRLADDVLSVVEASGGVDGAATVVFMIGGTDPETDDELRGRVLQRIREPPMGGDATDYVAWAEAVPGVTRAWCSPQEMGIGTCTLRFMMDDLRVANGGFPFPDDVAQVAAYINTVRPVTVKDMFVEAPIPHPVNVHITYVDLDNQATHGAIEASLLNEFYVRQRPGQTWYRAWSDEGIMNAPGVNAYDLVASDVPMPNNGSMAVLGDITYG
jgi:uncharacterized phage protein gp47/JayE